MSYPTDLRQTLDVTPGLDPGIQGQQALCKPPWIAGSSPAMTEERWA
jgi:hypothetical protein